MNFINNIRLKIGNYQFLKRLARLQRRRHVINLRDAKTVGILYDATEEHEYQMICDFVRNLQNDGKTVKALGYINYNIIPHYCIPKLSFDYFLKKEVNIWYVPSNKFIDNFINSDYDILIDLTIKNFFPIQYISGLSKARFKVGRDGEDHVDYYDFMFRLSENTTLPEYMKEIVNYLTIIQAG